MTSFSKRGSFDLNSSKLAFLSSGMLESSTSARSCLALPKLFLESVRAFLRDEDICPIDTVWTSDVPRTSDVGNKIKLVLEELNEDVVKGILLEIKKLDKSTNES